MKPIDGHIVKNENIWDILLNRRLLHVYYIDEYGSSGDYLDDFRFHYLSQGAVLLEFDNYQIFEITVDDNNSNLWLRSIQNQSLHHSHRCLTTQKSSWSRISNKIILAYDLVHDFYYKCDVKSSNKVDVVSSIKITFQNGERIYISNAGFLIENELISLTGDLIIYSDKRVGVEHKLLNENT
ncbi:hypothetical protein [Flammeovirga sp. EKP202]|uniref:hypothetical protein n=1 Tax=Flammeovirga sp. EKP202 TaxID=2770592 RepID=UPI00165F54A3|nr:hypothetical protein [Flammeovirga sp. EKP202]MBD0404634.1 hypothetical protein [Flammeovirga sp. EKP202]